MSYEFKSAEELTIRSVGIKSMITGIMLIVSGIFGLLSAFLNTDDFGVLKATILGLEASLVIAMGILMIIPSDNFRNIASTQGRDIDELMTGIRELSSGFRIILFMLGAIILLDIIILAGGA